MGSLFVPFGFKWKPYQIACGHVEALSSLQQIKKYTRISRVSLTMLCSCAHKTFKLFFWRWLSANAPHFIQMLAAKIAIKLITFKGTICSCVKSKIHPPPQQKEDISHTIRAFFRAIWNFAQQLFYTFYMMNCGNVSAFVVLEFYGLKLNLAWANVLLWQFH